ncbi:MAG: SDR family NAD(P)-dependent oxidoreductase [Rhodopseudomonas sp.]|uniref:SDR family NAD(P)-dependent oxidoreductase n=1 Tax=Rhodopseudomonas sp. TaxID=1078 RepID=UPI00181E3EA8|nr:SDR family NAD(P)-dependent oxidoreductase [Rhodopseudomonas sp.]NVN85504.1 SDR family NAD(P)-dependent oxidoreductase [Rhodopseudomonas sp.]
MTEPLSRPRRKNPLKKTQAPLTPQGVRSRTAHGLTAAAAEGRFELQVCADCAAVIYPPRDACPACLSARLPFKAVDPNGELVAETTVRISTDPYFRERTPWRIGSVKLDCGPVLVAHLHGDTIEGGRVRLALQLDRSGAPVLIAMPARDVPNMAEDVQLREMTCDPKFRRVLITDGRTQVGQAMAKAFSAAGASIVFVGIADAWKPFPGDAALKAIERVEIVPLDITDTESVTELAEQNGGRIDIIVNTAEYTRPGGIVERRGLVVARQEMDVRYFGLMRLAQAFGPALRFRGADGVNSATAFVNLLSVHALMNWPAFGAHSATEAACLSASQAMRAELRPGGVKVVNLFFGPTETEWFQSVPPPKVTPAAIAKATIDALTRGLEDVFVGDVAEDVRERLAANPKALERELAGS